jgi:hypothetical protein
VTALWQNFRPPPHSSAGAPVVYARCFRFSISAVNPHGNRSCESCTWRAGIDVEPQKEIFDQWGRFVARADLWLVGTRRIHEYDGDKHRERQTHRSDLARDRRLVEIDCQRMGFTSAQLLHEGAWIIASADRLLGRRWDPARLAAWEALLTDSLFRPAGRAQAYRHWERAL